MKALYCLALLIVTGCTFVGNSPEEIKHRKGAPIQDWSQPQ
jgi:hypothetical protein